MNLSRRSLLGASTLALGPIALALSGCSTGKGGSSGGNDDAFVLWMWPEGYGDKVLDAVTKEFPDLNLRQDVIGGDFKQKLTTTFSAGSGLPDITGVKGEDIAFFCSKADYFEDLNELGAKDIKGTYLDWKWEQATTKDGKQIGIPIDIGPTALFYRFDVFEEAGLPSEPAELEAAIRSWEEYFELGKELIAKKPGTYLIRNTASVFGTAWRQAGQGFVDENGTFIGDQDHIKKAWDLAIAANDAGINGALAAQTTDSAAAVNAGRLPADFGASWHLADLMSDAPDTTGKWHVCKHPGEAVNKGGSFLTVPKGAKDPKKSFEVLSFILNARNQALEYTNSGNFPAAPEAHSMPEVDGPVEFLGGQKAAEVFSAAAETVRPLYEDPNSETVNAPFYAELEQVESSKKDPAKAWSDAVTAAKRIAEQAGLTLA
ncbi:MULTISPECIES: extracellular solute-binding protein [Dermabacter]|mgnify:CR=1 FL=1|uniref:Sugar-binding protein n=2 Tax=Dermabacter TaxID=36739 RepID=A0ABR4SHH8_9MICO|nr:MULTISPECIES: extracellular solute-binding protein [Dermabacter]KDS92650.1 sugar-binding protein [Dermabacter hominis 1368]MCT1709934.1 extracellular solute-binding protein [Dermabacter hominis]MCT1806467.1 extracellular solute-binding protein [Dermabacter hominis]MDU4923203.1 extracellular solute-binding protein [Dermabacter sp.]